MRPQRTTINAKPAEWPEEVWREWDTNVAPLFGKGESCESANYFTPYPGGGNEWDPPRPKAGFVYVVNPGRMVAFVEWIPTPKREG